MDIRRATLNDLDSIVPLFNEYRMFYGQQSNSALARHFIEMRLLEHSSIIFLCFIEGTAVGFVQLYPSYSSIAACDVWILNDLFVLPGYRKLGIGAELITLAISFGRNTRRQKIVLSTASGNTVAQKLYERSGFLKMNFIPYEFIIK